MNPRPVLLQRSHILEKKFACFLIAILLFITLGLQAGCVYSFRGSSVPAHIKTIAIPLFDDQSGFGEADLREKFTRELITRFTSDNTLQVTDKNTADSMLEGTIISVRDEPSVVNPGERVSKQRITIVVKVAYQDLKLRKKIWERELNNWGDYCLSALARLPACLPDPNAPPEAGKKLRDPGIEEAVRKVAEDIVIQTVSGW